MAHEENRLGGVVEAALHHAMADEKWLTDMAGDSTIAQSTETEVFQALESYVTDELALVNKDA